MSNMTKKLYKEIHKFIRWADRNYPEWGEENDNENERKMYYRDI